MTVAITGYILLLLPRRYPIFSDPQGQLDKLVSNIEADLVSGLRVRSESELFDRPRSLVVIPDIHGDARGFIRCIWLGLTQVDGVNVEYERLEALLMAAAELGIYPEFPLSSSETVAIQLGDVVDRGPFSVLCLRILWSIQRVIGWQVVSLYGNHELMSAFGTERRYIHPSELKQFGTLAGRFREFRSGRPLGDSIANSSVAFARVAVGTARAVFFVHAGVSPALADEIPATGLDWLSQEMTRSIKDGDTAALSALLLREDSIVWTRILAFTDEEELCNQVLPKILLALKVKRIVIGHTPQQDHRMHTRCGSRIILTDCAVSRWMYGDDGQPAVLAFRPATNPSSDWDSIGAIYFREGLGVWEAAHRLSVEPLFAQRRALNGTLVHEVVRELSRYGTTSATFEVIYMDEGNAQTRGILDCTQGIDAFHRLAAVNEAARHLVDNAWFLPPVDTVVVSIIDSTFACRLSKMENDLVPIARTVFNSQLSEAAVAVGALLVSGVHIQAQSPEELLRLFSVERESSDLKLTSIAATATVVTQHPLSESLESLRRMINSVTRGMVKLS